MKVIRFDTEFRGSHERNLTPVCAVVQVDQEEKRYWFPEDQEQFKADWNGWMEEKLAIACFYASAEARFMLSIGYTVQDLLSWQWLDIWVFWRMLTHSHPEYKYGNKVIMYGKVKKWVKTTPPPDGIDEDLWGEDEEGNPVLVKPLKEQHKPVGRGLADAIAHQLGKDVDSAHKALMREIILTRTEYSQEEREAILDYCSVDVEYLLPLLNNLAAEVGKVTKGAVGIKSLLTLSRYPVCCGIMETNGIPIFVDKAKALGGNYKEADLALIQSCNEEFPFYTYTKTSKAQRDKGLGDKYWKEDYKVFETYINKCGLGAVWPKSEKSGQYKKDKDTLKDFRGDPTIAKLRVTKNSRNQLKYFRPEGFTKIQRNIGSDGRIRVMLSPFGSKTGRNQPGVAQGYLLGMSTWLRPLIGAEGKVIIGADFSAQEIAIQAHLSNDANFMRAYESSDPYVWMAKYAEMIPQEVNRTKAGYVGADGLLLPPEAQAQYKGVRETFKALMLGIGFGMGLNKLAAKMTQSRANALSAGQQQLLSKARLSTNPELLREAEAILEGVRVVPGYSDTDAYYPTPQKACTYKDYHYDIFRAYWRWRGQVINLYREHDSCNLPDGWSLLEGEIRDTTVGNFPVQGMGGCILRKAVERCLREGLEVVSPLHDAIYIVSTPEQADRDAEILVREMKAAVVDLCGSDFIRIEAKKYHTDWVNHTSTWTEEKQAAEFKDFGKYMG